MQSISHTEEALIAETLRQYPFLSMTSQIRTIKYPKTMSFKEYEKRQLSLSLNTMRTTDDEIIHYCSECKVIFKCKEEKCTFSTMAGMHSHCFYKAVCDIAEREDEEYD